MTYWFAYAKYLVLQAYFTLKSYDELPGQLMQQDYEDRRRVIPRPQRAASARSRRLG